MHNVAILFPGQGSQYIGMGKKIYNEFKFVKDLFNEASEILHLDLKKLCFEGNMKELSLSENTQPAIVTVSNAAFKVWKHKIEVEPKYLAGHSLGEISALVCSESIDFATGIQLAHMRGKYMQEAVAIKEGKMLAINDVDISIIQEQCERLQKKGYSIVVSNYNSSRQNVVSGENEALRIIKENLGENKEKAIYLNVSAPFHSPLMKPAASKFKEYLRKIEFKELRYPIISNVTATPYKDVRNISNMLIAQLTCSVHWEKTLKFLALQDITEVIDIGPKSILYNFANECLDANTYSFEKGIYSDIQSEKTLDRMKFLEECIKISVALPNYNNDLSENICTAYKELKSYLLSVKETKEEIDVNQIKQAIRIVLDMFKLKDVPVKEKKNRLSELINCLEVEKLYKEVLMDGN